MWVDETRPVMQGSRLTAWECVRDGIPHRLIADVAAASVMARGEVDLVVTGADRIAANGDTANKIGTYALAVLAASPPRAVLRRRAVLHHRSRRCRRGRRSRSRSVTPRRSGASGAQQTAPEASPVFNPAFDVTPAELISAIVTERGVFRPPYQFWASLSALPTVPRA